MDPQDWTASFTLGFDDLDAFLLMEVNNCTCDPADTFDLSMAFQSGSHADNQKTGGTPDQISLDESLEVAEPRKEHRAALNFSNISAISSPPHTGETNLTSSLQAFVLGHKDVKALSQVSLSISTTYVIANFEPAEMKQDFGNLGPKDKMGMVCKQHSYVEEAITFGSNNEIIAKEAQTTTSSLEDQAMSDVEDDPATESCQPATPQFVPAQAAGKRPDLGRPKFRSLREQLMGWEETDNDRDNMATDQPRDARVESKALEDASQPVETLAHFVNDRKAGQPSEPLVSLANSAKIEQPRPCLSLADGGKVGLSQKPLATPSDDEKAEQPQEPPVSLADDSEMDQTHVSSATNADNEKADKMPEALQELSHEKAKVVTSSSPLGSFSVGEQRATSTDANKTTPNASPSERVNISDPVLTEAALKPLLPERPALVAPKTVIQGASLEEPIVIDSSGDEQEEDSSGSEHRKRSSALSRVRYKPQRADGVIMWTDPKVEERFLSKTRAIWYHIQSQWMKVRQLPGLEGMLSVVQYNNLINTIASNSVENDVLAHDDVIMLRDRYKRVANQALSKLLSRSDRNLVRNLRRYMN
ncbi:hypothetical protein GQ44DRAFT_777182 [Phaeosphaeriaceae sp. PMI808]|nr:hypothetical protein GQ44DRAFT_777182 [Phaeosphaeriaceae sp. PMI808]